MSALPALLEELHCLAEVLLKGRAQDCALLCQLALKARSLIGQLPLRMRLLYSCHIGCKQLETDS